MGITVFITKTTSWDPRPETVYTTLSIGIIHREARANPDETALDLLTSSTHRMCLSQTHATL